MITATWITRDLARAAAIAVAGCGEEAGQFHFFLNAAAPVERTGPDGAVITPEETVTGSAACDRCRAVAHDHAP